ncbi:MAG: DNA polymerase [Puniceicoccaceae bacterium]
MSDPYLEKHFNGRIRSNIGVVVQAPHIVIDLDSKATKGVAVRHWLANMPELAFWPRESTAGGCHLHIHCKDVPPEVIESSGRNKKLTCTVAEKVTAEIFFGGNVAVAPSVHRDGHQYAWEVFENIPTVPWKKLEAMFLSGEPIRTRKSAGRPPGRTLSTLSGQYEGDLRTLDIVALAKQLGIYGRRLNGEEDKHSVKCPWCDEHSDGAHWNALDSSTVIWEAHDRGYPGFHCSHTSHGRKGLEEFLEWAQMREPGIVDRHCEQRRVWDSSAAISNPGNNGSSKTRPRILLPGGGRLDSEFAEDIGKILAKANLVYSKNGVPVEIQTIREKGKLKAGDAGTDNKAPENEYTGFSLLKPSRMITLIEKVVEPGILVSEKNPVTGEKESVFMPKSMSVNQANSLLISDGLLNNIPRIDRIFSYPLPLYDSETGAITVPNRGYDPRFNSFLLPDAPQLFDMDLEEAKRVLNYMIKDFCLKTKRDVIHNIAYWLTPMCRGLLDRWTSRVPLFLLQANRARAGKDYNAGVAMLLYLGRVLEDPPVSSDVDEFRKKLTSSMVAGRPFMHMSNCSGFIRNQVFEQVITNERWTDRLLGNNQEISIPNEMMFSMSGNLGLSFTPDLNARMRIINLHYSEEHENMRTFSNPDLHGWVMENRSTILSAFTAFVRHWDGEGRPEGPSPFTSFPSWARIVGGIMHSCGLGDPCLPDENAAAIGGDDETEHMRRLYQTAYEVSPEKWLTRKQIRDIVVEANDEADAGLFPWIDLSGHSGAIRFGTMLEKFVGRDFSDIRLIKDQTTSRVRRQKMRFTKDGGSRPKGQAVASLFGDLDIEDSGGRLGCVGRLSIPTYAREKNIDNICVEKNNVCKGGVEKTAKTSKTSTLYNMITSRDEFDAIAGEISKADDPLALDIETYGSDPLNPWRSHIRILSLALPGKSPWLIDLQATGYDLGDLGRAIESSELIIHNARFDLGFVAHHLGLHPQKVFCTMTAARLLTAGERMRNTLADVLRRYEIADIPKGLGKSDWGAMIFDDQLEYAAADVIHLHSLRECLEKDLQQAKLMRIWEIEKTLLSIVVRMEETGFKVDKTSLNRIRDQHRVKASELAGQVQTTLNSNFNPGSTDQLRNAFRKVGIELDSTAETVLAELDHPAAGLVLSMRGAEKTAQQAQSLLDAIESDGRIHAQFDATGTEAGRFSSRSPNLQNIGRGELRECFIVDDGKILVCADYSQVELRVAAAIANETKMIEAYQSGADLHRRTAALVLGKAEAEVSKDDRQLAKAVNFGLLYGQSAPGLVKYAKTSYGVDLRLSDAHRIRERFFQAYKGLAKWHEDTRKKANGDSLTETWTRLGRRRFMPQGGDRFWPRFSGALNTPVQGGAADGLKRALILLSSRLPVDATMISTVHDEIIIECRSDDADTVSKMMEDSMAEAMADIYPEIPVEVEAHTGRTWADTKS